MPPGSPPQAHGYELTATTDGNRREIHVARKSGDPMVGQLSSETLVINGEEFVILLTEVVGIDDASRVADKIVQKFRLPFDVQGASLAISASIG